MSDSLERDVRWLKAYALGSTLVMTVLLSAAFYVGPSERNPAGERFQEITTERLNIVGPDDTSRIVLSNEKRFPPPVLNGDTIRARSIAPAGMVFYDASGNEVGGFATVSARGTERAALVFDYANSEAIGLSKADTEDAYRAGISIADRLPLSADPLEEGTVGTERVSIANENGTARVVLNDGEGRPRVRLVVEESGAPRVEVLGEDGSVVDALGEK